MKTLYQLLAVAILFGAPTGLWAEELPLAEEGSPEAEQLRQAHESDVQGAMESPEEAAAHQKALDRERGTTTAPAEPAPAEPAPVEPTSSVGTAGSGRYADNGAANSDLAIESEPEWLKKGGDYRNPPKKGSGGTVAAAQPAQPGQAARPAKPAGPQGPPVMIVLRDSIFTPPLRFGPWSTDLGDKDRAILNSVAWLMKENPQKTPKVVIEAYSDNSGDPAINEALTVARANIVKAYLISQGVGVHRLHAKGMGDKNPIGSNDTPEGRAKNRRVEFIIQK